MESGRLSDLKKVQERWLTNFPTIDVVTNQYQTRINNKFKHFRIFQILTEPQVQKDSYHIYSEAVKHMPEEVKKQMKCQKPLRRGYTVWCMSKQQLSAKQEQRFKKSPPQYRLRVSEDDYTVIIKLVKQSDMNCQQYRQLITQLLNIRLKQLVLRNCEFKQLTRNVYFPKNSIYVRDSHAALEARVGYKFSLDYIDILLFCDLNNQTKVMSQRNFLQILYDKRQNKSLQYYQGKRVYKNYGDNRIFVIQHIDTKMNPLSKFQKDGKQITYLQYYKKYYQLQIYDRKQPLVAVKSFIKKQIKSKGQKIQKVNQIIYLVPELLSLVGVPQKVGSNFLKQIRLTPNKEIQMANQFIDKVNKNQQQFRIDYENRIGAAHLLPQPKLRINSFTQIYPQNGSISIKTQIRQPIQLKDVLIVHSIFNKKQDRQQIDQLIKKSFNEAGKRYGISIKQHFQLQIQANSPPQTWIKEIQKDYQKNGKPNFIILALLPREEQIKDQIKKYLTYKLKVPSQAFLREKFYSKRGTMSIASNIMKQITAKNGNSLWQLKPLKYYEQKTVIQISISVQKCGSRFECVMGRNTNKQITKYKFERCQIQTKQIPQQLLKKYFYTCIEQYIKSLQIKPSTIIVYRMGYNNQTYAAQNLKKQYNILMERINWISANKLKGYSPQVVYIQVFDRPAHKYWIQQEGKQQGTILPKVSNPLPGTTMRGITDNQFYLISYQCREGSAQPALFRVLENSKKVDIQFLVQFTYAQCYMYWNWQGSVRLPAILQFSKCIHQFIKPQNDGKIFTFNNVQFI